MAYVNTETGEWSKTLPKEDKVIKLTITDYVGKDTKFPDDCLDEEELKSVLRNLDGSLHYKVRIDEGYLLDCVIKGYLSPKGAESVKWVCRNICAWNYVFITKSEIIEAGITSKAHYSRWVKEMEPYFKISVLHKGLDNLKITVHPAVAWKGFDGFKNSAVGRYYGLRTFTE